MEPDGESDGPPDGDLKTGTRQKYIKEGLSLIRVFVGLDRINGKGIEN